jgi:hypothetical protein
VPCLHSWCFCPGALRCVKPPGVVGPISQNARHSPNARLNMTYNPCGRSLILRRLTPWGYNPSLLHKGFHFISSPKKWCTIYDNYDVPKNTKFTTYPNGTHNSLESWALQLWDSMIKVHMMHIDLYLVELGRLWLQSLPRSFSHNYYANLPSTTNTIWMGCSKNS